MVTKWIHWHPGCWTACIQLPVARLDCLWPCSIGPNLCLPMSCQSFSFSSSSLWLSHGLMVHHLQWQWLTITEALNQGAIDCISNTITILISYRLFFYSVVSLSSHSMPLVKDLVHRKSLSRLRPMVMWSILLSLGPVINCFPLQLPLHRPTSDTFALGSGVQGKFHSAQMGTEAFDFADHPYGAHLHCPPIGLIVIFLWIDYVFYYREEKKSIWLEITYTPVIDQSEDQSSGNSFELNGLHRGTLYHIYMRSMADKSAMSEPSEIITVRTEGESMYPDETVLLFYILSSVSFPSSPC